MTCFTDNAYNLNIHLKVKAWNWKYIVEWFGAIQVVCDVAIFYPPSHLVKCWNMSNACITRVVAPGLITDPLVLDVPIAFSKKIYISPQNTRGY